MNRDLSLAELYYGTAEPVPEARTLSAGRWSAQWVDGALRNIRHDGVEMIRSIAFLVRDRDWGTCSPAVGELEINEDAHTFRVQYRASCENPDGQRIEYRMVLSGDTDGGVTCSAACVASTDFLTARCGFCVLHPIDGVAGAQAVVEHGDGSSEASHFPTQIDPWQPFQDIRAISHRLVDGRWLRCELIGDTFEMEDQRNWSDASFKTYSRPLALPWPFVLDQGAEFEQRVQISISDAMPVSGNVTGDVTCNATGSAKSDAALGATGSATGSATDNAAGSAADNAAGDEASRAAGGDPGSGAGLDASNEAGGDVLDDAHSTTITLRDSALTMPELGLAIAPDEIDAVLEQMNVLRAMGVQRLSLHYDPLAGHDVNTLKRYTDITRQIDAHVNVTLEYALPGVGTPADELAVLAATLEESGLVVSGLMVSPSVHRQSNPPGSISPPCPALDDVYASARRYFPTLRLSGGMLSYFTEFNRKRPPVSMVDEVVHATCPIVHAADDASVMQTLEAVPHITRSCRALIGDQPYSIGPLTIGMRQNPYGSRTMPNPDKRRIAMADDDPRQRGLFGAAWFVGYVAATAHAKLSSLCIGAMTGPRGFIDARGHAYPIGAVLSVLAALGGNARFECTSSRPSEIAAFAGRRRDGERVMVVANLTARAQRFRFAPSASMPFDAPVRCLSIDESTFADFRTGTATTFDDGLDDRERVLKPFACLIASF